MGSVGRGDSCVRRVILVRIICTNLFHPFIGAQKCRCARPRRVSNFRIVNGEVDSESLAPVIGIDRDPGSYRQGRGNANETSPLELIQSWFVRGQVIAFNNVRNLALRVPNLSAMNKGPVLKPIVSTTSVSPS